MEFDLRNLNYLKLEVVKILNRTREQMSVLVLDVKQEIPMLIKLYENKEEEKHEYKILKLLQEDDVCQEIYLRDYSEGASFLLL